MKTTILSIVCLFAFSIAGICVNPINLSIYASNGQTRDGSGTCIIETTDHFFLEADAYSNGSGSDGFSAVLAELVDGNTVMADVRCIDRDGVSWKWAPDKDDYQGWIDYARYSYTVKTTYGISGMISLKLFW